jgi:membrane protein required for colicin V production
MFITYFISRFQPLVGNAFPDALRHTIKARIIMMQSIIMNWVDFSIITLILLSATISAFNGLVKELLSLLNWLLSFIIAIIFLDELASLFTTLIPFADLRLTIALLILFFSSFILFEWINYLILNSIGPIYLSVLDRVLGVVLGIARGFVVIILLTLLAGLTKLPTASWWQESILIHRFIPVVVELRRHLPIEIATNFNFEPAPEYQPP